MQTWEKQVLDKLDQEHEAKDILAEMEQCQDDKTLLFLAHKLMARRDQSSWIKQNIEAIIYADEAKNTRRDQGKEKD